MTAQKQTEIKQTTHIVEDLGPENSPAVIAYRVGKLEQTVSEGFSQINTKLDKLDGFITKKEAEKIVEEERKDAAEVHKGLSDRIEKLEDWKDGLVGKIAGAAVVMLVLMLLALYGLDKFFKI